MPTTNMEVQIRLQCGHTVLLPVESVREARRLSENQMDILCKQCKEKKKILYVGIPYHTKYYHEESNNSILGAKK